MGEEAALLAKVRDRLCSLQGILDAEDTIEAHMAERWVSEIKFDLMRAMGIIMRAEESDEQGNG